MSGERRVISRTLAQGALDRGSLFHAYDDRSVPATTGREDYIIQAPASTLVDMDILVRADGALAVVFTEGVTPGGALTAVSSIIGLNRISKPVPGTTVERDAGTPTGGSQGLIFRRTAANTDYVSLMQAPLRLEPGVDYGLTFLNAGGSPVLLDLHWVWTEVPA